MKTPSAALLALVSLASGSVLRERATSFTCTDYALCCNEWVADATHGIIATGCVSGSTAHTNTCATPAHTDALCCQVDVPLLQVGVGCVAPAPATSSTSHPTSTSTSTSTTTSTTTTSTSTTTTTTSTTSSIPTTSSTTTTTSSTIRSVPTAAACPVGSFALGLYSGTNFVTYLGLPTSNDANHPYQEVSTTLAGAGNFSAEASGTTGCRLVDSNGYYIHLVGNGETFTCSTRSRAADVRAYTSPGPISGVGTDAVAIWSWDGTTIDGVFPNGGLCPVYLVYYPQGTQTIDVPRLLWTLDSTLYTANQVTFHAVPFA